MQIITDNAEAKLLNTLEILRKNPDNMRVAHFKLSKIRKSLEQSQINELIKKHLTIANPQIFVTSDSDIFILAPALSGKEVKSLTEDIAHLFDISEHEDLTIIYELNHHINQFTSVIEQKLAAHNLMLTKTESKQPSTNQKRLDILSKQPPKEKTSTISYRRTKRTSPEMMIIEDDAFTCRLVKNVLQNNYHLTSLNTADYALEMYADIAPNAIFLDINLPNISGHELLEKIIAIDPQAYVVMLSGNSDRDNIMQAMNKGAKGFVAKPFTREKLFQYIDKCPTIKH